MKDHEDTWECASSHKQKRKLKKQSEKTIQCTISSENIIRRYLTKLCNKPYIDHDGRKCMQAHDKKELRRPPYREKTNELRYSKEPCPDFPQCTKEDKCLMAHGRYEVMFHPALFKTLDCKRGRKCDFTFCAYSHNELEKRVWNDSNAAVKKERTTSLGEYISLEKKHRVEPHGIIEKIEDWIGWQQKFQSMIVLPCPLEDVFSRMLFKYEQLKIDIRDICLSKGCTPFLQVQNRQRSSPVMLVIQSTSEKDSYEAIDHIQKYLQSWRAKTEDVFTPRYVRYLENDSEGVEKLREFCRQVKELDISVNISENKVILYGSSRKVRQDILYELRTISTHFALSNAKIVADAKLQSLQLELDNTRKELQQALMKQEESKSQKKSIVSFPTEWETTSGFHEILVKQNSTEWDRVYTMFMSTIQEHSKVHSLPEVNKITRIENHQLWKHYSLLQEEIYNEMNLWHGTRKESLDPISRYGFNRSYAGMNATAYGLGTYFAKNSGYSLSYASRDQDSVFRNPPRRMILAKVLVGRYLQGSNRMKEPILNDVRFDSAVNNVDKPTIFVVFKDYQAYPGYIVEFVA